VNEPIYDVVILGAEKQAATSIVGAYPELKFLLLTDRPVVDGWDLSNATIRFATPETWEKAIQVSAPLVIPVSSRWNKAATTLDQTLHSLRYVAPEAVLPCLSIPSQYWKKWIVKGNSFHKPDEIIIGGEETDSLPEDKYGCGYCYQEYLTGVSQHMLITGHWKDQHNTGFAVFKVLNESIAREDQLVACETVWDESLNALAQKLLNSLCYVGFFSITLIRGDFGTRITSFRPIPKAVFGTMRAGGVSLLDYSSGIRIAKAGLKLIGDIHYSSYRTIGL
jgi:hypothetical protein